MYGQPVGSLSGQVATLERRLAEYEANPDYQSMYQKLVAVNRLHPMVHGPQDQNWCPTCSVQYPCQTVIALGGR